MPEIEISSPTPETIMPSKKKRNLPGMPDPDAEVVALSPESLTATNRFVCEVCGKGFQREQNLQLHRRGHNLPWKLKQRTSDEALRKRVYVCPEPSCVHHHPSRALGDLTSIKKHFSRKHCEKKHDCHRCSKKYAVHSDWKAHVRTCGTRQYTCHCGTLFSRRDSFITHRSFCQVAAPPRLQPEPTSPAGDLKSQTHVALSPSTETELPENENKKAYREPLPPRPPQGEAATLTITTSSSSSSDGAGGAISTVLNSSTSEHSQSSPYPCNLLCPLSGLGRSAIDPMYLSLSSSSSFYEPSSSSQNPMYLSRPQPALSATALLQRAAQMGSTSSDPSFLHGLGLALPYSSSSNEMMMCPSGLFGGKPTTLDFLGLGMGVGDVNLSGGMSWDSSSKPSGI